MSSKVFQTIEIIQLMSEYLKEKGIDNARLNAELLAGYVLNLDRVQLYLNFEKPLEPLEVNKLRALLKRRANHEPIQYIIGETEFYSLKFKVNQHTLIPRPETEVLIDNILDSFKKYFNHQQEIHILDIGTGCGNIPVTLAKNLEHVHLNSIDVDAEALEIAKQNANAHNVSDRINFKIDDIFENNSISFPQIDLIVSNPPYISEKEFNHLPAEIKHFEPRRALLGGKDGLKFYHQIAELSRKILSDQGLVILEIGANQGEAVKTIFQHKNIFNKIDIKKDFNQLDRVIIAKK